MNTEWTQELVDLIENDIRRLEENRACRIVMVLNRTTDNRAGFSSQLVTFQEMTREILMDFVSLTQVCSMRCDRQTEGTIEGQRTFTEQFSTILPARLENKDRRMNEERTKRRFTLGGRLSSSALWSLQDEEILIEGNRRAVSYSMLSD